MFYFVKQKIFVTDPFNVVQMCNILYLKCSVSNLHRGFLIGDQAPLPSPLDPKKRKPLSGRASPLVSAGQVLDKYISLSNRPHSREKSDLKPLKKIGINDDIRQDVCCVEFMFFVL